MNALKFFNTLCLLACISSCYVSASPAIEDNLVTSEPCRIEGYQYEIECGQLDVPLNHEAQPTKLLTVSWKRVKSYARYPQRDPLIWIPNVSSVSPTKRAPQMISLLARTLSQRDLIWIDFRGIGDSSAINCKPDTNATLEKKLNRFNQTYLDKCRSLIDKTGGIELYSPNQIAKDYERLRTHLNLQQVNLLVEGNSSVIAAIWVKIAKPAIRSIVIDNPEIPFAKIEKQTDTLIANLNRACKLVPECISINGDIYKNLLAILDALPVKVISKHPFALKNESVLIDDIMFHSLLMNILYNPTRATTLPYALKNAANNNWDAFIGLASGSWIKHDDFIDDGLHIAYGCQVKSTSETFLKTAFQRWLQNTSEQKYLKVCRDVHHERASDYPSFLREKDIPILLMIGKLNPNIEEKKHTFSNTFLLEVAGAGANLMNYGCAKDIVHAFISSGNIESLKSTHTDCLSKIPMPYLNVPPLISKDF